MAYPAYDTYNNQVAFPMSRRQSMAYTDGYAYDAPMTTGVYDPVRTTSHPRHPYRSHPPVSIDQNYPQAGYPAYAPSRQLSQYNGYATGALYPLIYLDTKDTT